FFSLCYLHRLSHFFFSFFFLCYGDTRHLHSFPTRRSSDLSISVPSRSIRSSVVPPVAQLSMASSPAPGPIVRRSIAPDASITLRDRKSTRLNSSHVAISYAVFCLKKKKNTQFIEHTQLNIH